ncbi:MAG: FUN14 domain-containing protein [Candidatus Xenobia bacterium]
MELDSIPWKLIGTEAGFGFVTGLCVGFAVRKLTMILAFAIGVLVIIMQVLVFYGLVTVNWAGFETIFHQSLPHVKGLWPMLTANIPYAGAFGVGFWAGIRMR